MENPSCISHVSLGTNDFEKASAFYDAALATLGIKRILDYPGMIGYGKVYPEFWIHAPADGNPATPGNGVHVSFIADTQDAVHAFHAAAVAAGGTDDGAPGPRPNYGEGYYAAFIRDLDGHKIEALCLDMEKAGH